jgi:hypothetical protein
LKYDLELKIKPEPDKVFSGVKEVITPNLNTSEDKEPVNNIHNSENERTGVKVFTHYEGKAIDFENFQF